MLKIGVKFQIATYVVLSHIESAARVACRGAGLAAEVLSDV